MVEDLREVLDAVHLAVAGEELGEVEAFGFFPGKYLCVEEKQDQIYKSLRQFRRAVDLALDEISQKLVY